jgi:hypothetical protein
MRSLGGSIVRQRGHFAYFNTAAFSGLIAISVDGLWSPNIKYRIAKKAIKHNITRTGILTVECENTSDVQIFKPKIFVVRRRRIIQKVF